MSQFNRLLCLRFCRVLVAFSVLIGFLLSTGVMQVWSDDISKTTQKKLTKIVDYYQAGRSLNVIEEGGRLIQQLEEKELDDVNKYLKTKLLDSLQAMLIDARIDLDRPNVSARIPAPTNKEAIYLAWEIHDRVDRTELEFLAHPAVVGDITSPEEYSDYEKHFWDLHVYRNELTNAIRWLNQVDGLLDQRKKRLVSAAVSDSKKEIVEFDFGKRAESITKLLQDLEEREAYLRIFRIQDTMARDLPGASEKDRFTFAYYLELDIRFLESFFKRHEGVTFERGDLNDQSILTEISSEALEVREKYADKIAKGTQLFLGMHWWFRGRYGSGPLARGLLKAPGAHVDEEALFPLAMPVAVPTPKDPYESEYRIPHYERRHHYTWQMQQESVYSYQPPPLRQVRKSNADIPDGKQYRKFY